MTTIATPDADSAARQDLLERYAWLAIRVGINLEPGREVAIRAMIEHAPLVRALVRAGYAAGARRVEVDYEDLEVLRSQIALAPDEAVGTAPGWMFERLDDVREQRRAQVSVIGFPPDMFDGLDPARVARSFPAVAPRRSARRSASSGSRRHALGSLSPARHPPGPSGCTASLTWSDSGRRSPTSAGSTSQIPSRPGRRTSTTWKRVLHC